MTILNRCFAVFTVLSSLLLSMHVYANDDASLYDPKAPDGSAFIRVFNAHTTKNLDIHLDNKKIGNIPALKVTEYSFTPPGSHNLTLGDKNITVNLDKSTPYTLVYFKGGKHQLIKDQLFTSQKKALLSFYNLVSGSPVNVTTADGKVKVFESVAPEAVVHRKINAVKVNLAVFNGDKKVAKAETHSLRRGEISSLFYVNGALKPVAIWQ